MPMGASLRVFIAALMLALVAAFAVPSASAQQPAQVNPTAQSVKEKELLQELQKIQGRTTLPDKRTGVLEIAARVNQLEREADRVHQDAIVELFDQETDPIAVIKWKEILDFLEAATDRCEDVGNLLEGVVVKHG